MRRIAAILFAMVVLLSITLHAGTTGKLTGKVIDKETGEPLPFVNIILEGTMLGAATDMEGNYVILNIPPGVYTVKAQFVGYQTVRVEGVRISVDLTTRQNIEMSSATVELGEVVVTGGRELVRKDVTATEARVTSEQIENLPVAELDDVLQLQAGVNRGAGGEFHIRGGRSSEIAYWVNGISITDGYDNSQGIEIDNSSVKELQVITGTFNAEYGQAMSGIVNTVTKEGGQSFNGYVNVYSGDYVSNHTKVFPNIDHLNPAENYNFQANFGGPVPGTSKKLTFFVNGRHAYDDGWLYGFRKFSTTGDTLNGEAVPMNWSKRWLAQANLSFYASKYFKFNLEALYSKRNYQDYNHFFKWEPDGNNFQFADAYNATLTMTHTFSPSSFYTVKASVFDKEYNSYLYEDPLDSRYLHPDSLNTVGFAFATKGTSLGRFWRRTTTYVGKIDFTSQVSTHHMIKTGAEIKTHKIRVDGYSIQPALNEFGVPIEPFRPAIPGKDELGREAYTEDPLEFSAYIQDKIEYEEVIINLGLRMDYFDANGNVLVDETDPNIYLPLRQGLDSLSLSERRPYFYKDSSPKWQLSPRLGIAYPVSAGGVVRFSYGHFLQIPSFQYLYNNTSYKVPLSGNPGSVYGNPDLKPQQTVMYEIGFKQEFMNTFSLDVTAFYRDIRNWITAGTIVETRNGIGYSRYVNKDYANVKGITFNVSKRFSDYWSFDVNYTYQVAEGSNSRPEEEFDAQRSDREPSLYLIPLDWDQRHLLNINFYVGGETWGGSLLGRYGTGLPYTPSITQYTSERGITSGFQRNSRRKPNQFTMDLRLHKSFELSGINVTTFLRVFNILDTKVVTNVFGDTGDPEFTTVGQNVGEDPNRPNTVAEYLISPWNYGEPRKVEFGFEFSF
ncbi:MAG: TonB-dependent receptor [Ignavibacteria bacterium]|nr:MAG: TonB-dependent receptor [Ignavibacteria bacterium]